MSVDPLDTLPRRAVEHLLHTARRHLHMEGAFLAELTGTTQLYHATSGAESFAITAGGTLPRVESYCQYVLESGEPWVVRDTTVDERARRLAITAAGDFGAYIGVPVHLPGGRPFGTLCCLSHVARPDLGDRDVAILQALADTLAFHVGQLEDRTEHIAALEAHADELTRAIRQSELRLGLFAEMIHASDTPTLVLDPGTLTIDFANLAAARLLGTTVHEVVGTPPWDHRTSWTGEAFAQRLRPLVEDRTRTVRYEEEAADGWPPLDVLVQRVTSDTDDTMILWTALDITERREVERRLERIAASEHAAAEQLRRLERLREDFLSAVSHEIRTPLTAILGYVATLRGRTVPNELSPTMMERLAVNAERLDRLLVDLLDLNEFTQGASQVRRERVRLDTLIRKTLERAELEGAAPRVDLAPIEAEVAPAEFERTVHSLVRNAWVHGQEDGPIEVRLEPAQGGALLIVSDQGPGIPREDRDDVFQPFWQGSTAPAHSPGMGIGLSLVAAFAELHGGRYWVEDAPGGGAAFHVWLPTDAETT